MFAFDSVLGVINDWMLRNDGDYLLLYKISTTEAKTWVLDPLQALVVCLIDGGTCYGNLVQELGKILAVSCDRSKELLDGVLSVLNADEGIVEDVKLTRCRSFSTEDFFIPLAQYRPPDTARLALPTKIGLFVTARCCADCVYCYADRRAATSTSLLQYSRWKEIIDECIDLRILNLDLLGGDTLSTNGARDVLMYLLKSGIQAFVSTKCEITPQIAGELVEAGFLDTEYSEENILQLSIDCADPSLADYLSGAEDFLGRCTRSVAACLAAGVHPRVKSVLTSRNFDRISSVVEYFSQRGVQDFQFVQYGISHFRYREDLFLSSDQKARIRDDAASVRSLNPELTIAVQDDIDQPLTATEKQEAWQRRARCTGGFTSIVITPEGDVIACEQLPQTSEFILADLRDGSIRDAWKDARFDAFLFPERSLYAGSPCERCEDFLACHADAGFCYRDSLLAYGTVYEAPPSCPRQTRQGRRLL